MNEVKIEGTTYIITKDATDDMQEDITTGVKFVSGRGYRKGDTDQTPVEIIWELDGDLTSEDASGWRNDWETADEAIKLEEF